MTFFSWCPIQSINPLLYLSISPIYISPPAVTISPRLWLEFPLPQEKATPVPRLAWKLAIRVFPTLYETMEKKMQEKK